MIDRNTQKLECQLKDLDKCEGEVTLYPFCGINGFATMCFGHAYHLSNDEKCRELRAKVAKRLQEPTKPFNWNGRFKISSGIQP